jgi:hypothetical protein
MPAGPFQLKYKLFESFSGSFWRVTDKNNNEFNMKTFSLMSDVSSSLEIRISFSLGSQLRKRCSSS